MDLTSPGCAAVALSTAIGLADPVQLQDGQARWAVAAPVAAGAVGELSFTLLERPASPSLMEVRLSAAGVRLIDNRLGWGDVVDPLANQPRIRVRFEAPTMPGRYPVTGRVSYVSCRGDRCRPRVVRVTWTVEVFDLGDRAAPSASGRPGP